MPRFNPPWKGPPVDFDSPPKLPMYGFKGVSPEEARRRMFEKAFAPYKTPKTGVWVIRPGETREQWLRRVNRKELTVYSPDLGTLVDIYLDIAFEREPSEEKLLIALRTLTQYGVVSLKELNRALRGTRQDRVILIDEAMSDIHENSQMSEKWQSRVDELWGVDLTIYGILQELKEGG